MDDAPVPLETLLAHRAWVSRVAHALVADPHLAEDLEQDLWVETLERPPRVRGSLRGWIARALRNDLLDLRRGEARRKRREESVARPEGGPSTAETVADAEALRRVVNAVMDLEEPARATVLLRFYEGLPPGEIARRQGIPVETVRTRLKRAIASLRERLDGEERGDRRAWVLALGPLLRKPGTAGVLMAKKAIAIAAGFLLLGTAAWWAAPHFLGAGGAPRDPRETAARPSPPRPRRTVSAEPLPAVVELAACDRERDLFGIVVDGQGAALGGVKVAAFRRPWRGLGVFALGESGKPVEGPSVLSAADGSFSLRLEPGAAADLHADARGFAPVVICDCPAGEQLRVVLREGARVVAAVRDEAGAPVAGTVVRMWRVAGAMEPPAPSEHVFDRTETTGADGTAVFAGLTRGWALLAADHPERGSAEWQNVTIPESGEARFDVVLPAGRTLRGRVVDGRTGAALAGARIGEGWTFHREVRTGVDGNFSLPCWKDGPDCELFAEGEGFATASVVPDAGGDVEVSLLPGDRVIGRVVDSAGVPVTGAAGILQAIEAPGGSTVMEVRPVAAGNDGRFTVAGVATDRPHALVLEGSARGRAVRRLDPHGGEAGTIDLGDVALSARSVAGVLQDGKGEPLPRRGVVLEGPHGDGLPAPGTAGTRVSCRTDDLGRFRFGGLAPGAFELRLADRAFSQETLAVAVPAERDVTGLVFRLKPAGKGVTIRVVDEAGAPLPGIPIQLMEPGVPGGGRDGKSGPDGRISFQKFQEGGFWFTVNRTMTGGGDERFVPYARINDGIVFPEGQEIEVVLHEAAEVSGVVMDSGGKPVPGLFVQAAEADGKPRYWPTKTPSDSGAEFTLTVPRGIPLTLLVSQEWDGSRSVPSRWRARQKGVVAPASGVRVEVRPVRSDLSLDVRVLDVEGVPVPGATVQVFRPGFVKEEVSDAAGNARFQGLPDDEFSLYVRPAAGTVLPEGVLPPKTGAATAGGAAVTVQFRRGRVREGLVLDPEGKPAPNAEVLSQGVDGGASSEPVLTDAEGRFRVAVEPGVRQHFSAHIFRAPAEDWLGFAEGVLPGDEDVVIRLRPRSALSPFR